jgi:hypothetical protein
VSHSRRRSGLLWQRCMCNKFKAVSGQIHRWRTLHRTRRSGQQTAPLSTPQNLTSQARLCACKHDGQSTRFGLCAPERVCETLKGFWGVGLGVTAHAGGRQQGVVACCWCAVTHRTSNTPLPAGWPAHVIINLGHPSPRCTHLDSSTAPLGIGVGLAKVVGTRQARASAEDLSCVSSRTGQGRWCVGMSGLMAQASSGWGMRQPCWPSRGPWTAEPLGGVPQPRAPHTPTSMPVPARRRAISLAVIRFISCEWGGWAC